jgi:hypothetical protein
VLINVQPALSAASMWVPSYASTSTMLMGAVASLAAPWIFTPRTTNLNPVPSLTSTGMIIRILSSMESFSAGTSQTGPTYIWGRAWWVEGLVGGPESPETCLGRDRGRGSGMETENLDIVAGGNIKGEFQDGYGLLV